MNILTIDALRERKYSSQLKIEEQVKNEEKFTSYTASYDSDGLKIYGYLVVPKLVTSNKAQVTRNQLIIFCHGRMPEPKEYLPQHQYARHCEYLASNGFVVFKPDYRGHGNSQGEAETIFESGYAVDVLNAIEAFRVAVLPQGVMLEKDKIGIMGHSLGGNIALKVMEVKPNIKAGVIWGGAVAGFDEILSRWGKNNSLRPVAEELIANYGEPKSNPEFWKSISPINFLKYIQAAILIQHGEQDESIPTSQAIVLEKALKFAEKPVELILYKNGTHNFGEAKISRSPYNFEGKIYDEAIQQATSFFNSKLR